MKERWLIMAIIGWLSIYLSGYFKFGFIIIGCLYYLIKYKDKSIIILLLVLIALNIDFYRYTYDLYETYKVIKISPYSTIVKAKGRYFKTKKLNVGLDDVISIDGNLTEITDEYYFYGLASKNYYHQSFVYQSIDVNNYKIVEEGHSLRRKLYDLASSQEDDLNSFYKAILFHYNDDYLTFSDGIESFIYASGIYLTSFVKILRFIFGYLFYEEVLDIFCLIGFIFYGLNTRFTCCIMRQILKILLKNIKDKKEKVGLNIIILLIINPYFAYNLAFLLPITFQLLNLGLKKVNSISKFLSFSIIQLSLNFKFNLLNSFLYQYLSYVFIFIYFSSYICLLLNLKIIPRFYIWLISLFKDFRIFDISGKPNIVILCLFVYFLFLYQSQREKKCLYVIAILLVVNQYQSFLNPFSSITFLNVNHGDCLIYHNRFSSGCLMIDTANTFYYRRVTNYLNALGIRKIDKLIITHSDSDHSANLDSLVNDYKVKEIINTKQDEIEYKDINLIGLNTDKVYEDENSNSLVFITQINNLKYLFMADATIESEEDILSKYPNLNVDVIKIGHHGSDTSTSYNLLAKTLPRLAIISCGNYNYYHHPSDTVLEKLAAFHVYKLTTQEVGDIQIYSLFKYNLLINAKGGYAIIKERQ